MAEFTRRSERNVMANGLTAVRVEFPNVDWTKSSIEDMLIGKVKTEAVLLFSSYVFSKGRFTVVRTSVPELRVHVEVRSAMPVSATRGEIAAFLRVLKVDGRTNEPKIPKKPEEFKSLNYEDVNIFDSTAIGVGSAINVVLDIGHQLRSMYCGYVVSVCSAPQLTMDELVFMCATPLDTSLPVGVQLYPEMTAFNDDGKEVTMDQLAVSDKADALLAETMDALAKLQSEDISKEAMVKAIIDQRSQPQPQLQPQPDEQS